MIEIVRGGSPPGGHPHIEHMLAYAHGEMSGPEADAVLLHGLACSECGNVLAVMLALTGRAMTLVGAREAGEQVRTEADEPVATEAFEQVATAKERDEPAESDEPVDAPRAAISWLPVIAASIVVALTLGAVLLSWWPGDVAGPQDVPRIAGDTTPRQGQGGSDATAAPPALDPAASARLRALATVTPPDRVTLDFLFGPQATVAARIRARTGFAFVSERRYDEAIAQLSPLVAASPDDGEAAAALGIALYLSGDDGERAEALLQQGRALRLQDFSRLSSWYLGNLFLRRGDVVQARAVLEPLTAETDGPGMDARDLLERVRAEGQ
jgi:tetratricopeptide (TPR) repeat protein